MGMHQGVDLSRFKKIASDGKTSTLLHSKGHQIKIAHSGLTQKMQEHINNMPMHLANGGGPEMGTGENDDSQLLTDVANSQKPMPPTPDIAASLAPKPNPLVVNISPSSYTPPAQALAEQNPVMPVAQVTPMESMPAPQPSTFQPADLSQPEPKSVSAKITPQEKMAEHVSYATDLANGHIAPKTYNELFADKSTLGKIGTLFGLMLSGAGSGLSHQPNMLMEMMNKEIERDFERQKQEKEGARNFLSVQYQHNLQQAQAAESAMRTLGKQVELMPKVAGSADYLKSVGMPGAYNFMKDAEDRAQKIWSDYEGKAKMYETVIHDLDLKTKNNPAANNMVQNVLRPAVVKKVQGLMTEGGERSKEALQQKQASGQPMAVVNEGKLSRAIRLGQSTPQGVPYQPGAINPQDIPAIQAEKGELLMNRNGLHDWDDSFRKLADMKYAGQAPGVSAAVTGAGGLIGSLLGPLGAGVGGAIANEAGKITQGAFERARSVQKEALRQRLGRSASDASSEALIDSLLPNWNDTPESRIEAYRKGVQHFKSMEKTPILDTYSSQIPGLKTAFPKLEYKPRELEEPKKNEKKAPKTSKQTGK